MEFGIERLETRMRLSEPGALETEGSTGLLKARGAIFSASSLIRNHPQWTRHLTRGIRREWHEDSKNLALIHK